MSRVKMTQTASALHCKMLKKIQFGHESLGISPFLTYIRNVTLSVK